MTCERKGCTNAAAPHGRFCSDRCRAAAWRSRQRGGPEAPREATDPEVEAVLAQERLAARLEARGRELAAVRAALRELELRHDRLLETAGLRREVLEAPAPPTWLRPPRSAKAHHGTLVTLFSDQHLDEVVRPQEVDHLNAYNRQIAEQRVERYFERLVALSRDYMQGIRYDGLVLGLLGDTLSGTIHAELAETNEATLFQSILHWVPRFAAGLEYLADEFGKVHVPVVIGNHPRLTRKPRSKLRAVDNADWLFGHMLQQRVAHDRRVTFDLPEGTDALVQVYTTRFLMTHGDQVQGGQGIGGIWPPIMRMRARKLTRYQASGRGFDWLAMGHWHQLVVAQGIIVNGSVVGYNEFAATNNFAPERAQQALVLVTPEHGVTWSTPVFVDSPDVEGWTRAA